MEAAVEMMNYLEHGGATSAQIDEFVEFCVLFEDLGIEGRYEVYRLWARLLRHRRTPYRRNQKFDWSPKLKNYLCVVTGREIINDPAP